ncbi:mitochondrial dicarboxylate carrier-like [Biomphalaria glabrata]|uniref:Mitochondrial dicarboxylate carrier-like n=2 Tax=Biomphalaria TaxID=6525 RepID=A0A9W2ZLU7_BIOGL|nr:mitochondrial dicarboxylate carrier-like [Biomphalaria glabrata]XP_055875890.1 mitochondrial dicarboxylate carrier-like [Biomphalaria glabrata]XP_055875891.1 mitochondrial dicarboxylate carrier-like [Biomphalaria glabrata]XP_055875892.1 mitochondrial dicarboxylate carrier-like [Biomphalaria glabrata]XP_055875893.1 mitochondrial dicarboxylate carrier-like [Biomphalaria glabrata]XP_055875894.1 mitochondrial dicarboxylate carrier-like [Biomphalaria glabrata]KAK0046143.1 mitochondrial dicarbox
MPEIDKTKRIGRWYFGGVASAMAACCTHPLDLLKVHLQTQQGGKVSLAQMAVKVVKNDGIMGLYNGISASLLRQMTYSLTRFAIYETVKKELTKDGRNMPFYEKVGLASIAGASGGFVGTPADLVNVRMQNDVKLPAAERRNYKHAIDGLYQVVSKEGTFKAFNGATMACSRAVFVTVGQLACYDQLKNLLLKTGFFEDNLYLHLTSSTLAGTIATFLTQPLDVMKTRMMNAPTGYYKSIMSCAIDIGKNGPFGFFKGFVPAFVRLGPHTVLTFVFFEQIRLNLGDDPKPQ